MKAPKLLDLVIATAALTFAVAPLARAAPMPEATQLLVDMVDTTGPEDEAALEAKLGGIDLRLNSIHADDERLFVADVDPNDLHDLIRRLDGDPRVEHAEPNYIMGLPELARTPLAAYIASGSESSIERGPRQPDDPLWNKQWSFRMIHAPEAWAAADGSGVVVAVIDTGVAFETFKRFRLVEDLDAERFVEGYNFITDTAHANDDHGHGTHVAGTIAQSTFNARGVAGVAYKAKIMPLKVLSKRGFGTAGDIADAVRFAADEGAHVMNLSLGGGPRSRVLESAVAYARRKGVIVVCAAGNNGRPRVEYPAAYRGAFAVSSVGPTKDLAYYSSYGKEVAVAGPGGDKNVGGDDGGILQNTILANRLDLTGVYLSYQGTSMATPHVAGVAALLISAGVTNPDRVEGILRETAEDLGTRGRDDRFGHGLVDAAAAVNAARSDRGGLAHLGLALAAMMALLRRVGPRALGLLRSPGTLLGAVWASSGFGFLPGVLGLAVPMLDLSILGPSGHFTALWASALPMTLLVVAFLGVRWMRGVLVGLTVGWAAHLAATALLGSVDVLGIPGQGTLWDRGWLLINATLLLGVAVSAVRVALRR